MGFPGDSDGKESPAMWETWLQSLGWEDPLEKEMATQSSILAGITPWTEEPGGLQSLRSQRVRQDTAQHSHRRISQATVSMPAFSTLFLYNNMFSYS